MKHDHSQRMTKDVSKRTREKNSECGQGQKIYRSSVGRKTVTRQAFLKWPARGQSKDYSSLRAVIHARACSVLRNKMRGMKSTALAQRFSELTKETTGIVSSVREEWERKRGKTFGKVWFSCQEPSLNSSIFRQGKLILESLCWWLPTSVLKLSLLNPCLINSFLETYSKAQVSSRIVKAKPRLRIKGSRVVTHLEQKSQTLIILCVLLFHFCQGQRLIYSTNIPLLCAMLWIVVLPP